MFVIDYQRNRQTLQSTSFSSSLCLRLFSTAKELEETSSSEASSVVVSSSDEDSSFPLPCKSQPLGLPLPTDEHACSVSLPTWSSVVGYEEGDFEVVSAMKCGYPRFVYHPYVLQIMDLVIEQYARMTEDCLILPSAEAAVRCQAFLQRAVEDQRNTVDNCLLEGNDATRRLEQNDPSSSSSCSSRIRIVPLGAADIHAVIFPAETLAGTEAKAYWQHAGEVVSSRRAERALTELGIPLKKQVTDGPTICHSAFEEPQSCPYDELRQRIANWAKVPSADHVFLTPSGMCSIYVALRSARRYQLEKNPNGMGGTSIVFGFPYLDTLKMCSRAEFCPDGVEFFGHGNAKALDNLEHLLQTGRQNFSVLFTEVPSNPLLRCPDLFRLRELADKYDFALVVDDTISNFLNVDILEQGLADGVCSSLTKLVSGRGDAMAGSLVTNPKTQRGQWMQQDLLSKYNPTGGLYQADASAILQNSSDFEQRNATINKTAEGLADWLEEHPDVETVYYPKSEPLYEQVRSGGYGGLMSIILHPHMCQRTFYDALDVAKGPSLGTNFTLVCPYTLLAHYHELDFAMSYNVPPNLLRIAVGLEPLSELQSKFEHAFGRSRLHPKLPSQQRRLYSTISRRAMPSRSLQQTVRRFASFIR